MQVIEGWKLRLVRSPVAMDDSPSCVSEPDEQLLVESVDPILIPSQCEVSVWLSSSGLSLAKISTKT